MNKIAKGALAGAVAVALLVGGGTTLAYWNASQDLGGATITAGNLTLEADGTPTWVISHNDGTATPVTNLDDLRIVPGDTLTYSGAFTITAQGENLTIEAGITGGSIVAASTDANDVALAAQLTETATLTINGTDGAGPVTISHVSSTEGEYDVTIEVELVWPFGTDAAGDNPAKLGAVDLDDFTVSVTQVVTP